LNEAQHALKLRSHVRLALVVVAVACRSLGRAADAVPVLEASLAQVPDHLIYTELGETLRALERWDEALKAFDNSLALRPDDARVLGAKAQVCRALGHYDLAVEVLGKALQLEPDSAFLHAEMGEVLRIQKKFDQALKELDQALSLDAKEAFALGTKGQVLRELQRTEEAIRAFKEAVELEPTLDWARVELGEILLLEAHQPADALAVLQYVLADHPQDAYLLALTGSALKSLRQLEAAEQRLGQAVKIAADYAWAWSELAETLLLRGRHGEALTAINQSLQFNAASSAALELKIKILRISSRDDEALTVINQALRTKSTYGLLRSKALILHSKGLNEEALAAVIEGLGRAPKNVDLLVVKGRILRYLGRPEEALVDVWQAVRERPRFARAYIELASILCDLEYVDEALDVLRESNPDHLATNASGGSESETLDGLRPLHASDQADWLEVQARALMLKGCYQEAEDVLRRAVQEDPKSATLRGVHGWTLENLEKAGEALICYQAASEMDPNNWWWVKGMGNALLFLNRTAEAQQKYQETIDRIEKFPRQQELDADSVALLGWCYYRLGNYQEALKRITQALTLNPSFVSEQFDQALVLLEMGQEDKAKREYEKGLEAVRSKPVSRRPGVLRIGLRDLKWTLREPSRRRGPSDAALKLLQKNLVACNEASTRADEFSLSVMDWVNVKAPRNVVYYYLTRTDNYHQLLSDEVEKIVWDPTSDVATCKTKFLGMESKWRAQITERVPTARFAWQSLSEAGWCGALTLIPNGSETFLLARLTFNPAWQPIQSVHDNVVPLLKEFLDRFLSRVEAAIANVRPVGS
jgi:tetratricopeptide (TPR) repeat protein